MLNYEAVFLVDAGIGNAIEALYAVEYCLGNGVKAGIFLNGVSASFQSYLRTCYGQDVVLTSLHKVKTRHLIHSFTYEGYKDIFFETYFYVSPTVYSSEYLSETEQYLSIVRSLYPSGFRSSTLRHLKGETTSLLSSLQIHDKYVLYPGCSSFRSVSRWPFYIDLMTLLGEKNTVLIGGLDDLVFEFSYIYHPVLCRVLPQQALNQHSLWRMAKRFGLAIPYAHYPGIERRSNAYFNRLSWPELVALLQNCKSFIGNDGGLMQLAAACGATGVALFGATSSKKSKPYNPGMQVISTNFECQPCFFGVGGIVMAKTFINCPYGVRCMTSIRPQDVLKHVNHGN